MPTEKKEKPEANEPVAQNIQTEKTLADSGSQKEPEVEASGDSERQTA